ncbi:MAG TPA: phage tail protein [Steroidobacteraceae bacterium]|nr:phage tail protein [Steroidobacteraceae bacterium]
MNGPAANCVGRTGCVSSAAERLSRAFISSLSSSARFRNPPPGPPNDPTWMLLNGQSGWPIASPSNGIATSPRDCALVLQNAPGGSASLTDPSGRFGGLVPPPNVALAPDGTVFLLDVGRGRLRRFDECACAFVNIPHTGGRGRGARQFVTPIGIAARGDDLLILDAGAAASGAVAAAPGRLLVFARHGFSLRAVCFPPPHAFVSPWRPSTFAVAVDGRTAVADEANAAVHIFDRAGRWRAAWTGFPSVQAMTFDCHGRLYTLGTGATSVVITGWNGVEVAQASDVDTVRDCFASLVDFSSDASGRINLSGRCAGAEWFDPTGQPSTAPTAISPRYVGTGVWFSTALDSRIGRCTWHRIVLTAEVPARTSLTFATYTSEVALPIELIAVLPASSWTPVPLAASKPHEALILSAPGRYLWLQATLSGDQQCTPRLRELRIEYPRISLRRYLPRAFGPDPVSADFADRLLAVFDRGFRSIESQIDRQADWFDPRSARATSPVAGAPDMLTWLASWIGVTLDRTWSVAKRRHLLQSAARLYPCRGTVPGLRQALLLYLGLDECKVRRRPAACAPPCSAAPPPWQPPPLILEHWKIRRWLYLGAGRLGDAAVLWGQSITARSQLDSNAQLGVTRLDDSGAANLDPFAVDAYAFTVFVPVGCARTPQDRSSLQRLLAQQSPAWTPARLRIVRPRMRIGIQASIGFDSVVACWPEGVLLDQAELGRATVLGAAPNVDPGARVGGSRIGPGMRIA